MSVIIKSVLQGSLADNVGIKPNHTLISINNHEIMDVLDYDFYCCDIQLVIKYIDENKNTTECIISKSEHDSLGLEFETFLMDKHKICKNKCVFCFIDQNPKGMRESIYFKDDDSRLSFIFGNYITLTNLTDHEVNRIIKMKITPINISVHTTNPELRVEMMKNKHSGKCLDILKKFASNNIDINCQVVLCPGINDSNELVRTIEDLSKYIPNILSIACVPVGLTKYRDKLYNLKSYNKDTAAEVINLINYYGDKFKDKYNKRIVYPSDEFFLIAEMDIPDISYYDDFIQLSNGVGMITLLEDEFNNAIIDSKSEIINKHFKHHISIATGVAAYKLISSLINKLKFINASFSCDVYRINNDFFGHKITVAGLITAGDLINQLKYKDLGQYLLISESMLKSDEEIFLDDLTVADVELQLNVKIIKVRNDGYDFLKCIMDISGE